MSLAALRACLGRGAVGARKNFGGSWRLGRGVFGALLLYAGLREAESVSLAKLEYGCCAGAVSGGGGKRFTWFASPLAARTGDG